MATTTTVAATAAAAATTTATTSTKGTQQKLSRDGHSKNRKSPTKTERIETFSDIFISDASSKRLTKVRA